jgi:hypothetical protein
MVTNDRVLELAAKHVTSPPSAANLLAFAHALIAEHEASKRPPAAALLSEPVARAAPESLYVGLVTAKPAA